MYDIKIVSGLNYGDESKGLVTNAVSTSNSLTVLASNSCQRSHTVVHEGKRHAFRHFGSATFKGAATYFTQKFYVNPAMFRQEYEQLRAMGVYPKVYCHINAMVITPIDMFANVEVERRRGDSSFSSTGCGVWESLLRRQALKKNMLQMTSEQFIAKEDTIGNFTRRYIDMIVRYYANYLQEEKYPEVYAFLHGEALIDNILDDLFFMLKHITFIYDFAQEQALFRSYPLIVFENSQGLLLDENYNADVDHTTPAHIGTLIPSDFIGRMFNNDEVDIENIYVTRTYFTRHGKGDIGFHGECTKGEICLDMFDLTNVPNPHQGTLRYGKIYDDDAAAMIGRIRQDANYLTHIGHNHHESVVFTHTNEYAISQGIADTFAKEEDIQIYASDNEQTIEKISFN